MIMPAVCAVAILIILIYFLNLLTEVYRDIQRFRLDFFAYLQLNFTFLGAFLTLTTVIIRASLLDNFIYLALPTALYIAAWLIFYVYPYRSELILDKANAKVIGYFRLININRV